MRTAAKRIPALAVVVVLVTFLTFWMSSQLAGNPCIILLGNQARGEALAECEADLNLDDPFLLRYAQWFGDFVTGDLGQSYINNIETTELLANALPATLFLMLYSVALALVISIPLGVAMAYRADTRFDRTASAGLYGFLAVPNFALAVLLVFWFAIRWDWFPAIGYTSPTDDLVEHVRGMVLPVVALAAGQVAVFARILRTDMIATLSEDYIQMAKAKGLRDAPILFRHALKPSSFTLLTVAGINIVSLISGTLIIEVLFGINGVGSLIYGSVIQRDYLILQSLVALTAILVVAVNFAVDLLYGRLDPRVRHAAA
ncbi:MAG: ABC transporter permease [Actinomycetota bacterium]